MSRYRRDMINDTPARSSALNGAHVLGALREAAERLPLLRRKRGAAVAAPDPCAWSGPPPVRALPLDLDLPMSAFDPGAFGRCAKVSVAAFVDPMILEQTLRRIPAL